MIPYRIARELVYQLHQARQQEWLAKALSTIPMLVALYQGETREEVLMLWKKLTDAGYDIVEIHRQSVELYRAEGHSHEVIANALKKLYELFEKQAYWSAAEEMARGLLEVALQRMDRASEAAAHRASGWLAIQQGRYAEALDALEHALAIAQSMGDRLSEVYAIGNMGIAYYYQGEYDRALESFERQRAISEELGDREKLSLAIGNMGLVYYNHGEYDRAMDCYERHRAISEELGDRYGVSLAIGNMGNVYHYRGEYDRAVECFEHQRAISEELGNRYGLSSAISNIGNVYSDCGEHDRALEYYERSRAICEELGNRSGLSTTVGNMGGVYLDRDEYDRALECFQEALQGHRAIGFLHPVTEWLVGIAKVLLEIRRSSHQPSDYLMSYLHHAGQVGASSDGWQEFALTVTRQQADECLTLSKQLSKPNTLVAARLLLARIDAAEGKISAALEQLESMLVEATDDEQLAELYYWLWKTSPPGPLSVDGEGEEERRGEYGVGNDGKTDADTSLAPLSAGGEGLGGTPGSGLRSRGEALRLYELLLAKTPRHEYTKRIDELKTGNINV